MPLRIAREHRHLLRECLLLQMRHRLVSIRLCYISQSTGNVGNGVALKRPGIGGGVSSNRANRTGL